MSNKGNIIEQVLARVSIEKYFEEEIVPVNPGVYGKGLKKDFNNKLRGICPLHEEESPSFVVFTDVQKFYCHSCTASGDVIDLHIKVVKVTTGKDITREEAAKYLYNKYVKG